eukprot:s60_g52.t1
MLMEGADPASYESVLAQNVQLKLDLQSALSELSRKQESACLALWKPPPEGAIATDSLLAPVDKQMPFGAVGSEQLEPCTIGPCEPHDCSPCMDEGGHEEWLLASMKHNAKVCAKSLFNASFSSPLSAMLAALSPSLNSPPPVPARHSDPPRSASSPRALVSVLLGGAAVSPDGALAADLICICLWT